METIVIRTNAELTAYLKELKKLLKLAGKLSTAARLVVNADMKTISNRIEAMESVLDIYDNEVIALLAKDNFCNRKFKNKNQVTKN